MRRLAILALAMTLLAGWAAGILTAVAVTLCWIALPLFARGHDIKEP